MRKLLYYIVICIFFFYVVADAGHIIQKFTSASRTYLVDFDFEGAGVSWDATSGSEDCTFDAAGDWCDEYTTAPAPIKGSKSFGIYGNSGYVRYNLPSAYDELYMDFWVNTGASYSQFSLRLLDSSNNALLYVYLDNLRIQVFANQACYGTDISLDTDWHIRIYYKEDTDDTDGIIRIWQDTTDEDFDGDPADYECTNKNTHNADVARIALWHSTQATNDIVTDNLKIWEPDGYE